MRYTVIVDEEKRVVEVVLKSGIKGKAKCMPTDHFSYDIGITLALERAKVAEKNVENSVKSVKPIKKAKAEKPFKEGERVRFKSWEEMEKEYGVDSFGDIKCYLDFTTEMKPFCNTYATIREIDSSGEVILMLSSAKNISLSDWQFSTDMIKHIN